jgi:hypothetical protein
MTEAKKIGMSLLTASCQKAITRDQPAFPYGPRL